MKLLLYFFTTILLLACTEKASDKSNVVPEITETSKESKYENLLTKFKAITIDTFEVYSSYDYGKYKGIEIDSSDVVTFFPKEIVEEYYPGYGLFACYKFKIDSINTGLIARTPSMYDASSIKLFIYNKIEDKITGYNEIAENFGDAGDAMEKRSWIIKTKYKKLNVLLRRDESYNHQVEDINDTIIERWSYYYLIDISQAKFDTISKDSKVLTKKYNRLLDEDSH